MTDYSTTIDAETWAFIERTNSWYPPDTIDSTIAQQRDIYDRMCREFFAGYPDGVAARDEPVVAPGRSIPTRRYAKAGAKAEALVLYYHGGGFILGGLDSHDDVCAELCGRTGFDVVAVDYRMAPEHVHPAAFDDALAAFEWARDKSDKPIVLAGDSAGGNLAAAVSHAVRGRRRQPAGQMLIYPGLGGDMGKGSYVTHAEAPMLTMRDLLFYREVRSGGPARENDVTQAPFRDTDFSGLPPTVVVAAECDPLCDDGAEYCGRIVAAGGRAYSVVEPGLVHGYLRARHTVTRARQSFTRIVDAVAALGRGVWAY